MPLCKPEERWHCQARSGSNRTGVRQRTIMLINIIVSSTHTSTAQRLPFKGLYLDGGATIATLRGVSPRRPDTCAVHNRLARNGNKRRLQLGQCGGFVLCGVGDPMACGARVSAMWQQNHPLPLLARHDDGGEPVYHSATGVLPAKTARMTVAKNLTKAMRG